ncbi:MAG: hypothetical protein OXF79_30120 [Chloroflexi bacterium]|nr:hypothetical protein [Chloroflexota bacterium]
MPLTGKDVSEIKQLKFQLLEAVPANGTTIGNKALREKLEWEPDFYLAVRGRLIDDRKLVLGKGKGGSVRRLLAESPGMPEDAPDVAEVEEGQFTTERSLYAPMLKVIRNRWIKEQPFNNVIVEDTSQGGRRADGIWSRPDITVVASTTYTYVPNKHFDVVTFEVKHHNRIDVTAVYEALAHRRSATRSYVLVYVPDEKLPLFESPTLAEIADEATKHGVGFIVAGDPQDYDTWEIREEASNMVPDPSRLNKFIRDQLSEGTRDEIVRWFR